MRTYPGVKLGAFSDPGEREQIKVMHDYLRELAGATSGSLETGTRPVAIITGPSGSTSNVNATTIANIVWPVGSIFTAVVPTNPAVLLGIGTWTAFGAGKVLVGLNSADTDFDTAEETGGSKTQTPLGTVGAVTITGAIAAESSHTHGAGTLAADSGGAHTHTVTPTGSVSVSGPDSTAKTGTGGFGAASSIHIHTATFTGDSNTTSSNGSHTHTVSGTSAAGSSHTHGNGTLAGAAPTFTGSATSVLQPYIVVYMWKRTA